MTLLLPEHRPNLGPTLQFAQADVGLDDVVACWLAEPAVRATIAPHIHFDQLCELWTVMGHRDADRFVYLVSLSMDDPPFGAIKLTGTRVSFLVAPDLWGQGLGTRMIGTLCTHGPELLGARPHLEATTLRENVASRRILERVGFRFVGIRATETGAFQDSHLAYVWERCFG